MSNPLNLVPGKEYRVTKEFLDFDKIVHPVGETWVFAGTNFLPYEEGLTLFVVNPLKKNISYRLQWRVEEQADLINHFADFVIPVEDGE